MNNSTDLVLPEKYSSEIKPFFNSEDEYYKTRDEFYKNIEASLEDIYRKRQKSEEAAQIKRYR